MAGWVAACPHASLHLKWTGQKTISQLNLTAPTVGIAAQPTEVLISSPAGTRDLPVPQGGVLHFAPLKTNQLTISFPSVMATTAYNPLVGRATQLPVGLAGLTIPALASLSTGSPQRQHPVHAELRPGPVADRRRQDLPDLGLRHGRRPDRPDPAAAAPVHQRHGADPARGPAVATSPSTGLPLTVNGLSLKNAPASGSASAPARDGHDDRRHRPVLPRHLMEHRAPDWHHRGRRQSYLEVHQAASPGWTATLNGQRLTPVTLDGWQQAFIVPAGAGGQVVMTYTPASGYHLWLIIAIVAFAVLLVLAFWPRRRSGQPHRFFWRHPAADPTNAAPAAETIPPADSDLPPRDPETPRDPADLHDSVAPHDSRDAANLHDSVAPHDSRDAANLRDSAAPHGTRDPSNLHDSASLYDPANPQDPEDLRNPTSARDTTSPIPSASPGRTTSPSARWEPSSHAYWITVIAATVVLALVSGWLAFVVPAVLLVGWAVPRWVPWLAFLAMCVAGGFAIAELNHGPQSGFGAFGPAAQFAAIVALAAALISAPRLGRPTPEPAAAPYGPPFSARDPAPGEGP